MCVCKTHEYTTQGLRADAEASAGDEWRWQERVWPALQVGAVGGSPASDKTDGVEILFITVFPPFLVKSYGLSAKAAQSVNRYFDALSVMRLDEKLDVRGVEDLLEGFLFPLLSDVMAYVVVVFCRLAWASAWSNLARVQVVSEGNGDVLRIFIIYVFDDGGAKYVDSDFELFGRACLCHCLWGAPLRRLGGRHVHAECDRA